MKQQNKFEIEFYRDSEGNYTIPPNYVMDAVKETLESNIIFINSTPLLGNFNVLSKDNLDTFVYNVSMLTLFTKVEFPLDTEFKLTVITYAIRALLSNKTLEHLGKLKNPGRFYDFIKQCLYDTQDLSTNQRIDTIRHRLLNTTDDNI